MEHRRTGTLEGLNILSALRFYASPLKVMHDLVLR